MPEAVGRRCLECRSLVEIAHHALVCQRCGAAVHRRCRSVSITYRGETATRCTACGDARQGTPAPADAGRHEAAHGERALAYVAASVLALLTLALATTGVIVVCAAQTVRGDESWSVIGVGTLCAAFTGSWVLAVVLRQAPSAFGVRLPARADRREPV